MKALSFFILLPFIVGFSYPVSNVEIIRTNYTNTDAVAERCKTLINPAQISYNQINYCKYTNSSNHSACFQISSGFPSPVDCAFYDGIKADEKLIYYQSLTY